MKIKDVVCAAGSTGFYFDDQRAIKRGAGHDGMFYIGQPVTEGFSAVRMKGEAVSVMIVLEDGQIAFGDCAAVQYSGAGGRDPLFLAKDFIPIIEQYVRPMLLGREADDFRGLCAQMEAIEVNGHPLRRIAGQSGRGRKGNGTADVRGRCGRIRLHGQPDADPHLYAVRRRPL